MKLRERLDKVKQMAPGWEHYRAMSDVFPVLIQVVEQQHRAIQGLLDPATNEDGAWYREAHNAARAALALLDKED